MWYSVISVPSEACVCVSFSSAPVIIKVLNIYYRSKSRVSEHLLVRLEKVCLGLIYFLRKIGDYRWISRTSQMENKNRRHNSFLKCLTRKMENVSDFFFPSRKCDDNRLCVGNIQNK